MGTTPPITTNNPQNTRSTKPDQTKTANFRPFSARKGVTGFMHPSPTTRKGVAGFIKRRIRAADSQQGAQTLMLAASVTILVASEHEQRAFLHP